MTSGVEMARTTPRLALHSLKLEGERRILAGVLLLGLLHGVIVIFAMPPWQHYDEPTQFEYAWLIASRLVLPRYADYDQAERRQIASSMISHRFFKGMGFEPDLESKDQPIWIGISATAGLPLYYILEAVPLRLFLSADVETQLYVGRFVSLALFLLTIWLAFKIMAEFVPPGHFLRWSVPAGLALLPGFADLMTAINSDVGATFAFSLFLYAGVRLILRGASVRRLLAVGAATALCLLTKNTVIVALPLALVAISMTLPARWRLVTWGLFATAVIVVALAALSWEDASAWYRRSFQEQPTRARTTLAPLGDYAIRLVASGAAPLSDVSQHLTTEQVMELRGKRVTLGAWMWASAPVQAHLPILSDAVQTADRREMVGTEPSFHVVQATVPSDAKQLFVILRADQIAGPSQETTVYYDGVVLLAGEYSPDGTVAFDNPNGSSGTWDGQPFANLLRDGSGEEAWPSVRPWVERLSKQFLWTSYLSPTVLVAALLDWQFAGPIYGITTERLFVTFWGYFGWGHIPMPPVTYDILKVVTLLGLAGALFVLWKEYRRQASGAKWSIAWLALTTATVWGLVFSRGFFGLMDGIFYLPAARYAFPVMIPTIMILSAGWWAWLRRFPRLYVILFAGGFVVLNIISLMTINSYYAG